MLLRYTHTFVAGLATVVISTCLASRSSQSIGDFFAQPSDAPRPFQFDQLCARGSQTATLRLTGGTDGEWVGTRHDGLLQGRRKQRLTRSRRHPIPSWTLDPSGRCHCTCHPIASEQVSSSQTRSGRAAAGMRAVSVTTRVQRCIRADGIMIVERFICHTAGPEGTAPLAYPTTPSSAAATRAIGSWRTCAVGSPPRLASRGCPGARARAATTRARAPHPACVHTSTGRH